MKKVISILLIMVLAISVFVTPVTAGGTLPRVESYFYYKLKSDDVDFTKKPNFMVGDVNYDNKINAEDAMVVLLLSVNHNTVYDTPRAAEIISASYFKQLQAGKKVYHNTGARAFCESNVRILGDANLNYQCDAGDALQILQYSVGKRVEFDRKDFSDDGKHLFIKWFDEWYPGLYYYDKSNGIYHDLIWPWPPVTSTDIPTPTDMG